MPCVAASAAKILSNPVGQFPICRNRELGGHPTGFRRAPLKSRQPACKPGSGWPANKVHRRDGHSSGTPVTRRLKQPTRTAGSRHRSRSLGAYAPNSAPSLFGLAPGGVYRAAGVTAGAVRSYRTVSPLPRPLRPLPRKRERIKVGERRSVLCGTVPRLAPAGCYPAPLVHGARTFLPGNLSVSPERPSDRLTWAGMGISRASVKARVPMIAAQA